MNPHVVHARCMDQWSMGIRVDREGIFPGFLKVHIDQKVVSQPFLTVHDTISWIEHDQMAKIQFGMRSDDADGLRA